MKLKDFKLNVCVGNKVKEMRTTLDMTEEQLAQKVGTSMKNISRYESGITPIPVNIFFLILRTFNVSAIELLSDYFSDLDNKRPLIH
ncbi:MAG: helix-turn-helix transcriptional regulator [Morganella sp. (in: enterobacteria)]|uniref:helix-turn-helix domain-containing protein n=1 Tax=Morganella morganii TaxID=582 RepID=UPI0014047A25|nr:helix-turn-helix transcriptional regulator [Morganella morganii]MBS9571993.1 helix-turn-helix transcriptional regulator [Morganella morganii subsp. morganii]QIM77804.1 helix-turn-helix transcriptional regulator [Morganella morganii subsp. morganii]